MFEYFYHEVLRKTIISFGTLFNNITIKHKENDGDVVSVIKVPLAYGPTQKFLARLNQSPDLNKPFAITLPRMSFEFTGLTYDSSRKVTTTQTFLVKDPENNTEVKKTYMPVPYNMAFELSIMAKLNDDVLQIVEQILPYFQPQYNLTVELVDAVNEKKDIPIVLENITMQDDYDGDFNTRRVITYTLRFTAKTYLFGPVTTATRDIIRSVSVSYSAGNDPTGLARQLQYTATPRATRNYTGNVVTNLSEDVDSTSILVRVIDASTIQPNTYIDIDGEEMFVRSKANNILTVNRATDNTTPLSHLSGAEVRSITTQDNALIEYGDDFGFDGDVS